MPDGFQSTARRAEQMRLAIRSRVASRSFHLRRCNRYSELNRIFDDTEKTYTVIIHQIPKEIGGKKNELCTNQWVSA